MRMPRASGILLHPTSLPGPYGVGDLGPEVVEFLDFLKAAGQRWWQLLPLGPTGYGNSPYQSYSSYAGNPLLISLDALKEKGLLSANDLEEYPKLSDVRVDFDAVAAAKEGMLRKAFQNFKPRPKGYKEFVEANGAWLQDYALFRALKDSRQGSAWYDWEHALAMREPEALGRAREEVAETADYYRFVQYVFAQQWKAVREAGVSRGVGIIGDLPIFVAPDSADVWARPDLFMLDARGRSTFVAGVPPDYFATTGQLWGNPLYKWDAHAAEKFAWWIARFKAQTDRVDLVRLDHFRGFEAYWEVPAGSATAEHGRWAKGPGTAFLEALKDGLGSLPIVAEDLGEITAEVYALRDRFELPGMRVMQFGLDGEPSSAFHLPYNYVNHCFAYTGTHDNDTTEGWFHALPVGEPESKARHQAERVYGRRILGATGEGVHWEAIRAVMASVADTAIIPLQDLLGLGSQARMNVPGLAEGNWCWRFKAGEISVEIAGRLADVTAVCGRWNGAIPPAYGPPSEMFKAASLAEREPNSSAVKKKKAAVKGPAGKSK